MRANEFIKEGIQYQEEWWPNDLDEIFQVAEFDGRYWIADEDFAADNVQSMHKFLINVPNKNIISYDGTQVVLEHPDYNYNLVVDSGGGGDFHIHVFDLTKEEKLNENATMGGTCSGNVASVVSPMGVILRRPSYGEKINIKKLKKKINK